MISNLHLFGTAVTKTIPFRWSYVISRIGVTLKDCGSTKMRDNQDIATGSVIIRKTLIPEIANASLMTSR